MKDICFEKVVEWDEEHSEGFIKCLLLSFISIITLISLSQLIPQDILIYNPFGLTSFLSNILILIVSIFLGGFNLSKRKVIWRKVK